MGPTASGKTALSIELARRLDAEILSVDSMQVYRGMDIGTAKPTVMERRGVPHHMIDVVEPSEDFSVAEFRQMGRAVIAETDGPVIIAGGSGLHFRALVDPMSFAPTEPELRLELESESLEALVDGLLEIDPDAGEHLDLANRRRVVRAVEIARLSGQTPTSRADSAEADDVSRYVSDIDFRAIGVDAGGLTDERIDERLRLMRSGGLIDEVSHLAPTLGRAASQAVGYREVLSHLAGEISENDAFEAIGRNTRKLAKKQRTWFQRDPRIQWIPWDTDQKRADRAMELLS